jgi:meiotic recombination protein DMC1
MMMQDHYSLLIIDSIMALYRVDFSGRGQLSERQQDLGKFLSRLMKLAEQFNVAVVLTNQGMFFLTLVMADPGGGMGSFMGDTKKPIGGHVLAHASTTRLYFKKGKGEERICKVMDSPYIAESEAIFRLSNEGVTDPSD